VVSIVIPCWNQADFTRACVESIRRYTPERHEVVFVDNGSIDSTHQFLSGLRDPRYKVVSNFTNLGFPRACNQGAAFSKGEYLLFLNNDVMVSPEWLKGLLECLNSDKDIGLVGPRTNHIAGIQQENSGAYSTHDEYLEFARKYREVHRGEYRPYWRITGFCLLIKRTLFERLGGFDERFSPGNYEDDDLCVKSFLSGYRNVVCGDVFVHHYGSVTHRQVNHGDILKRNRAKFEEKWREWMSANNTISCAMIARNEDHIIGRCLDKVLPLVDEVVLVDTGSTDFTVEIAKARGEKVKVNRFKWCDDFAAARNFSKSKCSGDWILSLDADEFICGIDKNNLWPWGAYGYTQRSYTEATNWSKWTPNRGEYPEYEADTLGWIPAFMVRLFRNDPRIEWSFSVHEIVDPSLFRCGYGRAALEEPIHHYGKCDAATDLEKGRKYYEYLKEELKRNKDDLRTINELATQGQTLGKFGEAVGLWKRYLELFPRAFDAHYNLGHCYACLGRYEESLEESRKAMAIKPESKEAAMNAALILFKMGRYEESRDLSKDIMEQHPDYPSAIGCFNASVKKLQK